MILVTGANSLLASNVIPLLVEGGYFVRGLLRRASDYRGPKHPNLELAEGDFTSDECLRRVLPGCDAVIHTAALTSSSGRYYGDYYEVNVRASRRLAEAAVNHGVQRLVMVVSANVFGHGSREIPGCELNEMCEPFASSYYVRSKYEALNAVMAYRDRMEVVAVAPATIIGPHCSSHPSGRAVAAAYRKKMLFCAPGGGSFVHAGDAALGIVRALEKGENGEAYILCSENLTYKEFCKELFAESGRRRLCVRIPRLLMYIAGGAGSCLRVMGFHTKVSLPNMRISCATGYYHNYKASRDLCMEFRPVREAIRDAADWLAADGVLKIARPQPDAKKQAAEHI